VGRCSGGCSVAVLSRRGARMCGRPRFMGPRRSQGGRHRARGGRGRPPEAPPPRGQEPAVAPCGRHAVGVSRGQLHYCQGKAGRPARPTRRARVAGGVRAGSRRARPTAGRGPKRRAAGRRRGPRPSKAVMIRSEGRVVARGGSCRWRHCGVCGDAASPAPRGAPRARPAPTARQARAEPAPRRLRADAPAPARPRPFSPAAAGSRWGCAPRGCGGGCLGPSCWDVWPGLFMCTGSLHMGRHTAKE
jgi:hypothetical protein